MKTVLAVVIAFVLGAALVYFLLPARQLSTTPPPPQETHEAAVVVQPAGGSGNCKVKTYSPVMAGRPNDDFSWTIVADKDCADYVADLQIAVKNPQDAGDLRIPDTAPGPNRRANVPAYPGRCQHQPPPCHIPYKVTVKSKNSSQPDITEDPRIDIWP
jgi:hypothetical protein